jgi:hypothetical protein
MTAFEHLAPPELVGGVGQTELPDGLQRIPFRRWVLSGSVAGWADALIPSFDFVVFLYVPTKVRLPRLQR